MRLATLLACCVAFTAIAVAQDPSVSGKAEQELPPPKPPAPQGTLNIYRLNLEVAHATHPTVYCDTFPIVRMQNGRVYSLRLSEGTHDLTVADNPTPLNLNVVANKEYYVRVDYPVNAGTGSRPSLVTVPPDEARADMKQLRRLDSVYIEAATCGRP